MEGHKTLIAASVHRINVATSNKLLLNSSTAEDTGLNIDILVFHPDSNPNLELMAESSLAFMEFAVDKRPPAQFVPKQLFLRAVYIIFHCSRLVCLNELLRFLFSNNLKNSLEELLEVFLFDVLAK